MSLIDFTGRLVHLPPGSIVASSPSRETTLAMYLGDQASVSSAHRRPVM